MERMNTGRFFFSSYYFPFVNGQWVGAASRARMWCSRKCLTCSPRAGWLPVLSWAEPSAWWMTSTEPWLALGASALKASTAHIIHSGGNNPWIYGSSWCFRRGWQSQHSALPDWFLPLSPINCRHRLIRSFPFKHRVIKLSVCFQVETQGHMLKEPPGTGISGWHSNLSPSQQALGRGLGLSAFLAAQQTPSGYPASDSYGLEHGSCASRPPTRSLSFCWTWREILGCCWLFTALSLFF